MNKLRNGPAFTLIEMIMAMTILAMLMTSIGVAVHASLMSYNENEKVASATQLSRVILSRMMREVRTCEDLDSSGEQLLITPPDDGSGLTEIIYRLIDGSLCCLRTVNGEETTHVLIGPDDAVVNTFYVLREDDLEGQPISVTVRLALTVGDCSFGVTASAVPRQSQF